MHSRAASIALVLVIGGAMLAACVPTAARKNARLTDEVDVELIAGMQYFGSGEEDDGSSTTDEQLLHLEVDSQYAFKSEDGSGFAVQLKMPWTIVYSTLDFYYQLPETNTKWFFGFGAELGALPGVYAIGTYFVDDAFYISLTPRVLNANDRGQNAALINPQLSIGLAGKADVSFFVNYAYHTGNGFDFDIDLFGDDDDSHDYRKTFWLLGGSIRL